MNESINDVILWEAELCLPQFLVSIITATNIFLPIAGCNGDDDDDDGDDDDDDSCGGDDDGCDGTGDNDDDDDDNDLSSRLKILSLESSPNYLRLHRNLSTFQYLNIFLRRRRYSSIHPPIYPSA